MERAEYRPRIVQGTDSRLSLNMPMYRQPPQEGSCLVYSLWMSAEAIGVRTFSRERVERIYNELVNKEGKPGIYLDDLFEYAKLKIPELSLNLNWLYPNEDIAIKIANSVLTEKPVIALNYKRGHATAVAGINRDGTVVINDPFNGKKFVGVERIAARNARIPYVEISKAA